METNAWEEAYLRFETPEQEIRKFIARLESIGQRDWRRDAQIVEIFCGRGNGLKALERLGFSNLEGADLSSRLVGEYKGIGKTHVADCRQLPFPDNSRDVVIVQGGLHHLLKLPEDLDQTLAEVRRVLRLETGTFVAVEPWLTPFLQIVHFISEKKLMRRFSGKINAFATMVENEIETYEQWLNRPQEVLDLFEKHFVAVHSHKKLGKFTFVGKPRL